MNLTGWLFKLRWLRFRADAARRGDVEGTIGRSITGQVEGSVGGIGDSVPRQMAGRAVGQGLRRLLKK